MTDLIADPVNDRAEVARWMPPGLSDVLSDPAGHTMAEVLHAYAAVAGVEDTFKAWKGALRDDVARRAQDQRDADGVKWKGAEVPDVAQAFDTWHKRQIVVAVAEHERLAAWLAEHHPDAHESCVLTTDHYEVDEAAFESALHALRDSAAAEDCTVEDIRSIADAFAQAVRPVTEVTVDGDALAEVFHVIGERLCDDDGQVVPGTSVIPARFKSVTVKPASAHVDAIKAMIRRAVTAGGAS